MSLVRKSAPTIPSALDEFIFKDALIYSVPAGDPLFKTCFMRVIKGYLQQRFNGGMTLQDVLDGFVFIETRLSADLVRARDAGVAALVACLSEEKVAEFLGTEGYSGVTPEGYLAFLGKGITFGGDINNIFGMFKSVNEMKLRVVTDAKTEIEAILLILPKVKLAIECIRAELEIVDENDIAANSLLERIIKEHTPNCSQLINDTLEKSDGIHILEKLPKLIMLRVKEDRELLVVKYSQLRKTRWDDFSERAQALRSDIINLESERRLLADVSVTVESYLQELHVNKPEMTQSFKAGKAH